MISLSRRAQGSLIQIRPSAKRAAGSYHSTRYVGRFAPSPTGRLHFGSLIAATGSYLQARSQGGRWLVRIDDLDPPRQQPGASAHILRTLEAYGLHWDGEVVYQSRRTSVYLHALEKLLDTGHAYHCDCSRKDVDARGRIGPFGLVYPGTCRARGLSSGRGRSLRLRTHDRPISFDDALQGHYGQRLESEVGDFIVRRADGLIAYHLAVVVDDAAQGVTQVARGADLLDSTPRQIHLQQLLGLPTPDYLHLPNRGGRTRCEAQQADPCETSTSLRISNLSHRGAAVSQP